MNNWKNPGIPHKGWIEVGFEDVGEDSSDEFEECQMCGQERVRYIHIMQHPNYDYQLRVGCICAQNMSDDYVTAPQKEKDHKNKKRRKLSFLARDWKKSSKGNFVQKYKGHVITIVPSKYNTRCFGVYYDGQCYWKNPDTDENLSWDNARELAFDLVDLDLY